MVGLFVVGHQLDGFIIRHVYDLITAGPAGFCKNDKTAP
jgi:hypothetical protein